MIVQYKKQWIIIRFCATTTEMLKLLEEQFFVKLSVFGTWINGSNRTILFKLQGCLWSGISSHRWNEITSSTFCTRNCDILPCFQVTAARNCFGQNPFSSCTGPKILLSIFCSNILSCPYQLVNVQASHPYVTTGLIEVLYIFSFKLLFNALDFISAPHE